MNAVKRYHKGNDGYGRDSYEIPALAVLGTSDCGTRGEYYNPAPTELVTAELERFRAVLTENGIPSTYDLTRSGNVSMVKRWLCVTEPANFAKAFELAEAWLAEHYDDTEWVHSAKD